ncbi:MAG TPA: tetratricopeptide repeat protein [Bacteroidia bacterium]|jgi:tetratricopeptide (TPR) repeat protein
MKHWIVFIFLFSVTTGSISSSAQGTKGADSRSKAIDSLQKRLSFVSTDTDKVKLINDIARQYWSVDPVKAISFSDRSVSFIDSLLPSVDAGSELWHVLQRERARALVSLGVLHINTGRYDEALTYLQPALKIREELKDKKGVASVLNNIGLVYWNEADYEKALDNFLRSLQLREEEHDKGGMASSYNNIGLVYNDAGNPGKALEYYHLALGIDEQISDKRSIANDLNNIGAIHTYRKDYDVALEYYRKALRIDKELGEKKGEYTVYSNIGTIFRYKKEFDSAMVYLERSLKMSTELDDKLIMSQVIAKIGRVFADKGGIDTAIVYVKRAIALASGIRSFEDLKDDYEFLSNIYAGKKDFQSAYQYNLLLGVIKDSIDRNSKASKLAQVQMKYEFEKKEHQRELTEKENEERLKRERLLRNVLIAGFAAIVVFAFFIYRSLRENRKAKKIIEEQKLLVEEKNKDITDSIRYAQNIQEAFFPPKELKSKLFPEAFVLFQPRDVVSGDFYWFGEKDGKKLIAAVDCTGHGVPGALMSMIGNNFLNQVVHERGITDPEAVLSEMRHLVISSLKQTGDSMGAKDGMDAALLSFDPENETVKFSGANNPLWRCYRKDGKWTIEEYAPNKRPVGYFQGRSLPFMGHSIPLVKGESYYVFTDGYADQFGGPKGKKFKYSQLKELIISIQELPMPQQERIMLDRFNSWKGMLDQVDDVLVIGIKV